MKELKYSKVLSNGQVATLFVRVDKLQRGEAAFIGFVIGKSIRQNKFWWNDTSYNSIKSTGNCGLEGLLFALSIIEELKSSFKYIIVAWEDDKRKKAYKRLLDHGFIEGIYRDEDVYFWTRP